MLEERLVAVPNEINLLFLNCVLLANFNPRKKKTPASPAQLSRNIVSIAKTQGYDLSGRKSKDVAAELRDAYLTEVAKRIYWGAKATERSPVPGELLTKLNTMPEVALLYSGIWTISARHNLGSEAFIPADHAYNNLQENVGWVMRIGARLLEKTHSKHYRSEPAFATEKYMGIKQQVADLARRKAIRPELLVIPAELPEQLELF